MSLSDKRETMRKESLNLATTGDERLLVTTIFMFIQKQDKEFIKKLKEFPLGLNCTHLMIRPEEIDKLAGKDLI